MISKGNLSIKIKSILRDIEKVENKNILKDKIASRLESSFNCYYDGLKNSSFIIKNSISPKNVNYVVKNIEKGVDKDV